MRKSTALWIAIIALFLLNAGTLFFMLNSRHHGPPERMDGNRRFDNLVMRTLELTPEQAGQFEQMKRSHHEQMLQLDEATKQPFDAYFSLLAQPVTDTVTKDSLEQKITDLYRQRMRITFRHFADLKAICTPQQQQKFDALVPSLMQVMSTGEKNMDHRRRKMEEPPYKP